MVKCTKCLQEKERKDFYRRKDKKNGLTSHCKECRDEAMKEYRTTANYKKYDREYRRTPHLRMYRKIRWKYYGK